MTLAVYTIGWNDFNSGGTDVVVGDQHQVGLPNDDPMPDGDRIYFTAADGQQSGVAADQVEVVLKLDPAIGFYKEIEAFDVNGDGINLIGIQPPLRGPVSMMLPAAATAWLVFTKGKFLNIHTGMYQVGGIGLKAGMRLEFEWRTE